jgi:hypothetical protein
MVNGFGIKHFTSSIISFVGILKLSLYISEAVRIGASEFCIQNANLITYKFL